jgi:septum site-determining protein MinC
LDTLFATETMAELSARQGRVADAIAIYEHLISGAAPDDAARVEKWRARVAELGGGGAGATASPAASATSSPAASAAAPAPVAPSLGSALRQGEIRAAAERASLVIQEPVRSGQVIYADGRDLIVVGPVNSGAQLLADGHIHIYGALKGRAVAGARGARDAQVFCLALEAELVGVDTGYVTSDDIPPGLWGGPARVFLTPDGICAIAPLSVGKRATAPRPGAPYA